MILQDTVSILHFEDDRSNQVMVKNYLKKRFNAYVRTEPTLQNAHWYTENPHLLERYNAIICDWCFPKMDASTHLEEFSKCDKTVIFYTCISREDWELKVKNKLSRIPDNFHYIQKANVNFIGQLTEAIEHCI